MQSSGDNCTIDLIDFLEAFAIYSRNHLGDLIHCMLLVSRIDTLWTISDLEVNWTRQSTHFLKDRKTYFFSGPRING